jgi:hypothetical protein
MKATGVPSWKIVLNGPASPCRKHSPARGEGVPGGEVVQFPEHRGAARVGAAGALAGVVGGPAGDVGQDVPAAVVDAEVTRRIRVARRFQVAEQPRGGCTARVPGAADRVTDADDWFGSWVLTAVACQF